MKTGAMDFYLLGKARRTCYTLREGIVSGGQSCPFSGGGFMENMALVLIILLLILVELRNKK